MVSVPAELLRPSMEPRRRIGVILSVSADVTLMASLSREAPSKLPISIKLLLFARGSHY